MDYVEGSFVGTLQWRDPCADDEQAADDGCPLDLPDLVGTTTELTLEVTTATEMAEVETCPAREPVTESQGVERCDGRLMRMPIRVQLSTADGLLELELQQDVALDRGLEPGLGGAIFRADLGGRMTEELPDVELVEWFYWIDDDGSASTDIYVLAGGTGARTHRLLDVCVPDGPADDCDRYIVLDRR